MRKGLSIVFVFSSLLTGCIKDAPLNPEADVLSFSFPEGTLRTPNVEIYNNYIIAYPKTGVALQDYPTNTDNLTVTPGATWERIEKNPVNDTLFFIRVTSENKLQSKTYSVIQVENIPNVFDFENWVKFSGNYAYENPKQSTIQWYSSNNGTAIIWGNKTADEFPVRKIDAASIPNNLAVDFGHYSVELRTMVGPGNVMGRNIPCVAGSAFLGGFDALMGLSNPLKTTHFGIPFNSGRPSRLSGYYYYEESAEDFINADGSKTTGKKDTCTIYSVLFKTDSQVKFLDGTTIGNSPNLIARAEIPSSQFTDKNLQGKWVEFSVDFNYDLYPAPFKKEELLNNEYKITVVFSSSRGGDLYQGCPKNRLIVDNIRLHYDQIFE